MEGERVRGTEESAILEEGPANSSTQLRLVRPTQRLPKGDMDEIGKSLQGTSRPP